jgi:hypothetical protein
MLAELHCHSHHSRGVKVFTEGMASPLQIVKYAKQLGLDAIAVTDHHTVKGGVEALKYGKKINITVIPGVELNTEAGHLIGLGVEEEIGNKLSLDESLEKIREQGGVTVAPHPFDIKNEGIKNNAIKADAIESFNAISLDRISNIKSTRYANTCGKAKVNGSDAHSLEMIGYAVTNLDAWDLDSALSAIRKGRTFLKNEYIPVPVVTNWAVERLASSYEHTLDYINKNYTFPKDAIARKMLGLVHKSPGRIDYFFKALGYFAIGNAFLYSLGKGMLEL